MARSVHAEAIAQDQNAIMEAIVKVRCVVAEAHAGAYSVMMVVIVRVPFVTTAVGADR